MEDEIGHIYDDDWEIAEATLDTITKIRKMAEGIQTEGDEVLQTRVVGTKEVVRDWELWIPSVNSEFHSLINEKMALQKLNKEQYKMLKKKALETGRTIEELPSKMVWVIKPDAAAPMTGKRKSRWVICGNFEQEKEGQETYSGEQIAQPFDLWSRRRPRWVGRVLRFLNASLEEDDNEWIVIKPPHILVAQNYLEKDDVFLTLKAVYGLRRSPRLWGKTRDKGLREMTLEVGQKVYHLQLLLSEPNLWKVVEDQEIFDDGPSRVEGLLMTYVDDLFIVSCLLLVKAILVGIQGLWATTQPEYVSEEPVRFLGMEVSRVKGETGMIWKVTQQAYVTDLLQEEPDIKSRRIPITRDQGFEIEEEEEKESISTEDIRRAQKVVGELLWTVTRSRPDVMFAVAKMGSGTLRCPKKVREVGDQVKGYLKDSKGDGLMFPEDSGENTYLEVFTDASFGDQSYGCVMVLVHGSPVLWKCGKQSTSSLSTAESELQEIIDGMTAGESTFAVAQEIFGDLKRILWTDSQSAMAIMSSEGGSWRTRHLRLKSAHARARLQTGEWSIRHLPGERMISDIGTKPLTSPRIIALKKEMGMWVESERAVVETVELENALVESDQAGSSGGVEPERGVQVEKALRLLIMAAVLQVTRGDDSGHQLRGNEESFSFEMFMVGYTIAVVAITVVLTWAWMKRGQSSSSIGMSRPQSLEQPLVEETSRSERGVESVVIDEASGLERRAGRAAEPSDRGGDSSEVRPRPSSSREALSQWHEEMRRRSRGRNANRRRSFRSPRSFLVFVTRHGDRYHDCESCSSLSRSSLEQSI